MLKDKLELLIKEFSLLKEKIKAKLQSKDNTITNANTQLQESNRKVEPLLKETLLKEFKELTE